MNLKEKAKKFWNEHKYDIAEVVTIGSLFGLTMFIGWNLGAKAEFEAIAKGMKKMFEFNPEAQKIMFETAAKMDQT